MASVLSHGSAHVTAKRASRRLLRQWIQEEERTAQSLHAFRQWLVHLFERVGYRTSGTFTLPPKLRTYYGFESAHIDLDEGWIEKIVRDIVEDERVSRALASG